MGFMLGSSSFLQSPLSLSFLSPCSHRKVARRKVSAMASPHGESPVDGSGSSQRRALLLVGISVLPLLQFRAIAVEALIPGGRRRKRSRYNTSKAVSDNGHEEGKSMENPKRNKEDIRKLEEQGSKQPKLEISSQEDIGNLEAQGSKLSEQEISFQEPNKSEVHLQSSSDNPFVSLLNGLGIIGSGVLGALYATSQKEKAAMQSTIESMKIELTEKEADQALLKENFETRLLIQQEERENQVRRFKDEEASLSNQLVTVNGTIEALSQELNSEKKIVKELKAKVGQLENGIVQAGEDKKMVEAKLKEKMDTVDVLQDKISLLSLEINDKEKNIENLNSLLSGKESECKNLSSIIDQTKADLAEANSSVKQLKEEISKTREELNSKKSSVDVLNAKIKSLHAEKCDTEKNLHDLMKEHNYLKSSSERKRAIDSKLLSEKDDELHQLEEKLGLALSEASANQAMIAKLVKERNDVKVLLEEEVNATQKLKDELRTTQETLGVSRLEASNLSKELEEVKRSYGELMSKVSMMQDEFYEAKKLLNSNLDKGKSISKALSDELASIKEALERTKEELGLTSDELKAMMEDRESLKKELLDIYKKAEITAHELKEERKVVATLNRELDVLGKQMLKDAEARRALELDLDEATKSLDEMNKSALLLSKELENTNSRTASLEAEKEMLFKSLIEQKNIVKEAQENVEDAQNLITRLGSERESLEKRSKKLEEELAAAKGEILRLRRQTSTSKESVNERHQTTNELAAGAPFGVKKTASRRRKGGPTSEVS